MLDLKRANFPDGLVAMISACHLSKDKSRETGVRFPVEETRFLDLYLLVTGILDAIRF